jgi:hypothetical protein
MTRTRSVRTEDDRIHKVGITFPARLIMATFSGYLDDLEALEAENGGF